MPIYRAKIKCFVGESLREADEEFEYSGKFNSNIELVGGTEPDLPVPKHTNRSVRRCSTNYSIN
mgnify:CR=1 FL=1